MKLREFTKEQISEILEKHELWLLGKDGGERANLSSANLSSANLSSADLSSANLSYANLSYADLPNETWVIFGEKYFISIHNGNLRAGCQCHDVDTWRKFSDQEIEEMDSGALEFYPRLLKIIDFYCGDSK